MRKSRECGKSSPLQKITHLKKTSKQQGFGWQNTHKNLSPEPLSPSLADNNPSRLLCPTHPCTHHTSYYVHRFGGAHCAKTKTPDSKAVTTTTGGGQKFFFPQTNRFPDLSPYNRLQVIQHCSVISLSFFFQKLQSDNICFKYTVIFFFFLVRFSSFFVFFQTASFTFLSLCIFVSISHLLLEILCLVQYSTALN